MKKSRSVKIVILLAIFSLFWPGTTLAQEEPHLRLVTAEATVTVGQEMIVEVWVENAPAVYGIELHLTFDPTQLEVADLQHGDFFSSDPDKQAFVLQNQANNKAGTIDYALSLLNPAPAVAGNGLILQIGLKAKGEGRATVQVIDMLFGNQAGEKIGASSDPLGLEIKPKVAPLLAGTNEAELQPNPQEALADQEQTARGLSFDVWMLLLAGMVGIVVILAIVGGWFWVARSR